MGYLAKDLMRDHFNGAKTAILTALRRVQASRPILAELSGAPPARRAAALVRIALRRMVRLSKSRLAAISLSRRAVWVGSCRRERRIAATLPECVGRRPEGAHEFRIDL